MTQFTIENLAEEIVQEIDFSQFIDLVKGAAIVSAAIWDEGLELGISDNFNLRFQSGEDREFRVRLISTLNRDDIPALRLQILGEDEVATAERIQHRIFALRQVYAIALLIATDRLPNLVEGYQQNHDFDIEATLLNRTEHLQIQSAGPGSFWLSVIPKTKAAFFAAAKALALLTNEGRDAFLRTIRANATLRELEVEEKRLKIGLDKANGVFDILERLEKLSDRGVRDRIEATLVNSLDAIGADAHARLNPPKHAE